MPKKKQLTDKQKADNVIRDINKTTKIDKETFKKFNDKLTSESPTRKRKLSISRYEKNVSGITLTYVRVKNNRGNKIKDFVLDDDTHRNGIKIDKNDTPIKSLDSFQDKSGNEKIIRQFIQKHSDENYKPVSKKEHLEKRKQLEKEGLIKVKSVKEFADSKIIFSKSAKPPKNYTYTYIQVTVKIFFDGFYVLNVGRSDYLLKEDNPSYSARLRRKAGTLPSSNIRLYIRQAVNRALAPYGSDLKFELQDWSYAYYIRRVN